MRNGCRPLGRFFCLLLVATGTWLVTTANGQTNGPAMTQVTDTVYRADGSTAQGTVLISWPAFTTADGKAVAAGSLSVQLGNGGAFTASLAPNTGAQPAGVYYKVIYQLQGQGPSTEYWVVPATTSTTIGAVRATLQPATIAAQVLTRDVADSSYVHVNGDQTISGAKSFASLSAGAFQGIQYVCQQPGSDIGAKFQSAYNNLPADSGGHQMGTISFDGCSGYYSWTTPVTMTGARVKVVGNNNTTGKIAIQCNTTNCLTLNIPGSSVTSDGSNGSIFQGFEMDGNSSIPNQCGITVSDVYNVKGQDLYMASFNGSGSSAFCVKSNAVHSSGTEGFALDHVMFNQNLHAVTYNNNSGQNGGASFGYGSWKAVRCFSGAPGADCINLTGGLLYGTRIELDANLNASNSAAVRVSGNWIPSGNPSQFWYNAIDLDTESACSNCTNQAVFDLASGTLATGFFRVHVNSFGQPVAMLSSGSTAATFSNIAVSAGDTQTTTHVGHHPLCSGDPSQSAIGGNNEVCLLPYDNTALAQQGMGINASYDRTGAKYVAKGGSGNGATFLLGGNAGTLDIYALPSNGTSDQAISTSNLSKYLSLHLTNNGLFGYQGSGYTGGYGSWYWNISNLGVFNTFGSYQVKGNTVIDSSRNATVNNLTVNGTCTGCGTAVNLSSPPAIGDTTPNSGAFTTLAADDLVSKSFPVVDVRALGAVGDGKLIPDNCSMTAGSNVVTCTGSAASPPMIATGPPFAAGDVGKTFWIPGAGNIGSNNYLVATITTYVSASQVKLSSNAINSVPRSSAMFGHDNYAAFCAASNCTSTTVPNNWYGWPRTGKQIHVPAGMYLTSHPIYVRNGDMWWGDGETASQVRLMSAVNSVMAICMNGNASAGTDTCTLDAFANGASQTTTVRGLFLANGSMNTDYVNGPVGIYVAPGTSNFKIYNSWFDMSSVAIFAKNTNGGMIVDNLCDTATGLSCVVLDGTYTGSGNEYTTNQFSTVISGLQTWGGFNSITLHGVIGVTIERLQSMFIVAEDISFGTSQSPLSNQGSESSRRVVIADSFFQRSANPSYSGDPNDSFIIFREDCISCTISGNTFANSYLYDVQTQSAVNLNGLLIANNQFKDSQMKTQTGVGAPSVFLGNTGNTGLVTITNNHWENSGSYGLMSNQSVNLYGNTCHNPFQRSTPASGGIAASSCWYLADGAVNSVARDNVTDSSTYGSVGIATAGGHGATLDSSGNRSQWSTCDVCVTDATGGVVKSTNERASNSGSSGNGAFTASTTAGPVNAVGGLQVGGTTVVDSSRNATFNNLTVNGNCTGCGMSSNGYGYLVSRYASIQAAIDTAYNNGTVLGQVIDDRTAPYSGPGFIVRDSVTLKLAATTYTITSPVTYNNGVATVTAGIIALPGSHIVGVGTSPNHGTNVNAGAGLNADVIATSTVGTGTGANAQWWHWGSMENFHMDGNKANETAGNCINVENMGETAVLRALELGNCYASDLNLEGNFATQSEIANVTVNSAGQYGINLDKFQGVGVLRGLSGDSNATSIIRFNGNQSATLTVLGLKSEEEVSGHDPLITVDMPADGSQPSLYVIGGYTYARPGVKDVIKVINGKSGASPFINVNSFYVDSNFTNAVNDTVNSRTFAAANMNKVPFSYLPTGSYQSGQAFTFAPGTYIQGGTSALTEIFGSNTDGSSMIAAQGNGDGTSYFTGGLKIGIPNRTQFGQPPEMMARMGSRFLGVGQGYDTNTWVFVPIWKTGDNSNRWIGEPNQRWPEVYAADVNATTATVGTLNVTNCVGCGGSSGSGLLNYQANTATLAGNSTDQAIYSYTLPGGTMKAGTGVHCYLKAKRVSGSGAVTYKWKFGSTTAAYGSITSAAPSLTSDAEFFNNPGSTTTQIINLGEFHAGGAISSTALYNTAASENTANSTVISVTFNGASTEQIMGVNFKCIAEQ